MKIRVVVLALACLAPSSVLAQRLRKEMIYFGGMGGIATLSGDANAVITASSASTSSYDPSNGGAAEAFIGAHIFDYFSFQADYVWTGTTQCWFHQSTAQVYLVSIGCRKQSHKIHFWEMR